MLNANTTLASKNKNSGLSLFLNRREREAYDHNNDNFSEIPELKNTSIGLSAFFLPTDNQKFEISLSNLHEYRYGGELSDQPAHLALQSEERTHNVWMASADYQINFNDDRSNFIGYLAWQNTDRDHYTGIVPDIDDEIAYANHLASPPYGISLTRTFQGGIQLNHNLTRFLGGSNILTFGAEYLLDDTFDEMYLYYSSTMRTLNLEPAMVQDLELLKRLTQIFISHLQEEGCQESYYLKT